MNSPAVAGAVCPVHPEVLRIAPSGLLVMLLLWGSGCGEALCQKAHRIGASLNNKGAACVTGSPPIDVMTCEGTSKKCTPADIDGINRTLDCYEKLGECAVPTRDEWIGELRDCQDKMSPGSSVCLAM